MISCRGAKPLRPAGASRPQCFSRASRTDAALASTPSYELIIFDCDGVLVDSEVLSCQCLMDLLRRHEIEADLDFVFERFLGRSVRAVTDYYGAQGRKLPGDFPVELRARVRRSFAASLRPVPDVAKLLRGLDAPFCVASSSDLERVEFSLALTGLAEFFAGKMFSAEMVRARQAGARSFPARGGPHAGRPAQGALSSRTASAASRPERPPA